jgi:hypothetical protein
MLCYNTRFKCNYNKLRSIKKISSKHLEFICELVIKIRYLLILLLSLDKGIRINEKTIKCTIISFGISAS